MNVSPRFAAFIRVGIQLAALVWGAVTPQLVFAYDHPLNDDAVRQAYFLGQDVKGVHTFLASYLQSLPIPKSGADVAEIELRTPFAQVVEDSTQHSVNYSAQDAAAAYAKRGDYIEVRAEVLFTPSYNNVGPNFWRSVSVGLIQKEAIAASDVTGEPVYSTSEYGSVLIGANVYARFSVGDVHSSSVQVEVVPPEGLAVYATFDLHKLR